MLSENELGDHYLSVLNYPASIQLTTGFYTGSAVQDQSGQWTSSNVTSLGRINDGNDYLLVSMTSFPSTVTLTELLPGDFNDSSLVDAADYVLWRKSPGLLAPFLTNYDAWSENFSSDLGSGGASNNVPEPSAFVQFVVMLLLMSAYRQVKRCGRMSASASGFAIHK